MEKNLQNFLMNFKLQGGDEQLIKIYIEKSKKDFGDVVISQDNIYDYINPKKLAEAIKLVNDYPDEYLSKINKDATLLRYCLFVEKFF